RVLGDEHPDTLISIGNMGLLLSDLGKYDEAMPYYVEALETKRRALGDEHPDTLGSIGNMGLLLYSQGKYEEAMPYYVEVLETSRRVLGDEHEYMLNLNAIRNLAKLHDAWHEVEPDAGHDAKADEYRQLLEAIEAKKAETTEPAAP
ncbi:MAG: tetratricopeptide repeat protein, partial [Phycisphaerales bacterium]|nr:tetratricopeptide repeat protein [Phycisphaerales bacterium]